MACTRTFLVAAAVASAPAALFLGCGDEPRLAALSLPDAAALDAGAEAATVVTRLDHILWTAQLEAPGGGRLSRTIALADGTSVIAGTYAGTLTIGEAKLTGSPGEHAFVARLAKGGEVLWLKSVAPVERGKDPVVDLAVDDDGEVVLALGGVGAPPTSSRLIKLSGAKGNIRWVTTFVSGGDGSTAKLAHIAVRRGAVIVSGNISHSLSIFGPSGALEISRQEGKGAFLLVLDGDGKVQHSSTFGGGLQTSPEEPGEEELGPLAFDESGGVYAVGTFGTSRFHGPSGEVDAVPSDGGRPGGRFLFSFAPDFTGGRLLYSAPNLAASEVFFHALDVGSSGTVHLAGSLRGARDIAGETVTASNYDDALALRLSVSYGAGLPKLTLDAAEVAISEPSLGAPGPRSRIDRFTHVGTDELVFAGVYRGAPSLYGERLPDTVDTTPLRHFLFAQYGPKVGNKTKLLWAPPRETTSEVQLVGEGLAGSAMIVGANFAGSWRVNDETTLTQKLGTAGVSVGSAVVAFAIVR